ncbi:MAG: hypothetical protein EXS08_12260, partial [Planctomycetes bacterium]|nr:hypothetical protein [Planctomycetota bacterium]
KREILGCGVLQLDDTPIQCQAGKGAENFKAHLWTYTSPLSRGVVFDFALDWGHEHVAAFLGEKIEGCLVGDGYAGFGVSVQKYPALTEAGCWAHVLRKFRDAMKESPVEALRMVRRIAKLFDVEREAVEKKLEPEAVRALRAD